MMAEATTGDGEVEKPASRKPKLLLIGGFLLVLLAAAAVGIVWFFELFDAGRTGDAIEDAEMAETHDAAEATQRRADIVFVDIPDIL
jgi:flagellar basal body-associated protein FliL